MRLRATDREVAESRVLSPDHVSELWDWVGEVEDALDVHDPFDRMDHVPKLLENSPTLEYLRFPSRLARELRARHIRNVRHIELDGEGTADLETLGGPVAIETIGGYKVRPKLKPANFPELISVALRLPKTLDVARWVARFPKLEHLVLSPAREAQIAQLPRTLAGLDLVHGNPGHMDCAAHIDGLVSIGFHNLPKLTSLVGLARLPQLEEVGMSYCVNVDPEPLLSCEKLRFVDARFGCPTIKSIAPELAALLRARGGEMNLQTT